MTAKTSFLTVTDQFCGAGGSSIGAAMAFPDTYVVLGKKGEKVKQYGNAVTPPAIAILIERVVESLHRERGRTAA